MCYEIIFAAEFLSSVNLTNNFWVTEHEMARKILADKLNDCEIEQLKPKHRFCQPLVIMQYKQF